jgi:NitT/TauT family transport system ATP-binding protein
MKSSTVLINAEAAIPFMGHQPILPPLTCQIYANSLVCFLGQRFSILNIYLHMLAGMNPPDAGKVEHFVREQVSPTTKDFPVIAYLNYNSSLLSVLNGIENVKLPALYHQLGSKEQIEAQVYALLSELDYGANHKALPAFMSMLQKRHLLIARAIMLQPQLLFIENPFSDLELEEAGILGRYLADLVQHKNMTIITSNASLDFVEDYAEQIIYATPDDFQFFYQWEAFFQYKRLNRLKF